MKTIVFINSNKTGSSREAIRAADKMGYFTVLLTDKLSFLNQSGFPEIKLVKRVNLNDMDELRRVIKRLNQGKFDIKCIISFVDQYCYVAAQLAEEFGINKFTIDGIMTMEDKILSRKAIKDSPYSPKFLKLDPHESINTREVKKLIPFMLKSPSSAGSKDVFKIKNMDEFNTYRKRLTRKYPKEPLLLEEFLDGPQYLVECVVINKKVHIIAVIEQEITFYNRYIITGYNLIINPNKKFYDSLKTAVNDIIDLHGLENGSCHLEMRLVDKQWKLIETNPRISGSGMNEFLQIGLGINLVKETLKLALGETPDLEPKFKKHTFAQYIIVKQKGILNRILGKRTAQSSPNVKSVYIKPKKGALLTPPESMGNRYAYVIATGKTENEAKKNAKYAASKIKFILVPYVSRRNRRS
jgi:biotin carboxylase